MIIILELKGLLSTYRVEITELVKWKRWVKIGATENGQCSKFVGCFTGMNPIPAYIVVWVFTSRCCHIGSIDHLGVSTVNLWMKIIGTTTISTTSSGAISKTCSKTKTKETSDFTVSLNSSLLAFWKSTLFKINFPEFSPKNVITMGSGMLEKL